MGLNFDMQFEGEQRKHLPEGSLQESHSNEGVGWTPKQSG